VTFRSDSPDFDGDGDDGHDSNGPGSRAGPGSSAGSGPGNGAGPSAGGPASTWTARLRQRFGRRRHGRHGRHGRQGRHASGDSKRSGGTAGTPQRTGFVLAGGGSRGAVQVGMLQELVARGIRADRVFGASVGAINGAAYAGNPTAEGIDHMADVWRGVRGGDIFPKGPLDGPWAFFQKRASVHANTGLRRIIRDGVRFENLEDAQIPVEVVTTSLTDGRERWITRGPAVEAILASSAIPTMFPPVTIDGDVLVDGGVVNNVPISRALTAGCDRIYVLLCGPLHYHPKTPARPVEALLTAFFVNPSLVTLSGVLTPIEAMPRWLQPVTVISPITHFVTIARTALLKGGGLAELWPHVAALAVLTLVLLTLSVWRFRKQMA